MEKQPYESQRMFELRKSVFANAVRSGETEAKGLVYANVWANMEYLRCEYNPELAEKARNYAPSNNSA